MDNDRTAEIKISPAEPQDAEGIANLCAQLGYPTSQDQLAQRLQRIAAWQQHAVFVARLINRRVVGWVHIFVRPLLIADLGAALGGVVVDETLRGRGIGRRLMARAEQWARKRGCTIVWVRSRTTRHDAHAFYTSIGFETTKTSLTFEKHF